MTDEEADRHTIDSLIASIVVSTREEIWFVALANSIVGLGWLWGGPARTQSPVYATAKDVFEWVPLYPMRVWGLILTVLGAGALVAIVLRIPSVYMVVMSGLVLYWSTLTWVFLLAYANGLNSILGTVLAVGWARRHFKLSRVAPWQLKA